MEKKTILVFNILAQVFWYAVAGVATYFVSTTWLSGINQPWKSILGGLVFVGIIFFLSIITNVIKTKKSPDVQAASRFHLTVAQYRKFKTLFDLLLYDEMMSSENIREMLYDVTVQTQKEWKTYCLSRECEYKPFYHKGKEIFIRDKSNKYVKGVITNISFGIEWWYYTIEFTKPISINDGWPSERTTVLAKTIMDIEANDLKCDDTHYVF